MNNRAIGVIITLVIFVLGGIFFHMTRPNQETQKNIRDGVEQGYQGMLETFEVYKKNALSQVAVLAKNPQIIDAAKRRDVQALFKITMPLMRDSKLEYMVITDPKGFVIIRTHEPGKIPKSDDNIANQVNVAQAMAGKTSVGIEEGKVVRLSVRAGAPLYDDSGTLVGVLSTGYVISQNDMLDTAKKASGADFTVLLGTERVATTLKNAEGKRLVGTKLTDQNIIQYVLAGGKTFIGAERIDGKDYSVYYGPLVGSDGKIVGMICAEKPR